MIFRETQRKLPSAVENIGVRRKKVESVADLWGTRWFMLPNPVYGSWDQILPKTVKERMDLLKRASNRGIRRGEVSYRFTRPFSRCPLSFKRNLPWLLSLRANWLGSNTK